MSVSSISTNWTKQSIIINQIKFTDFYRLINQLILTDFYRLTTTGNYYDEAWLAVK